MRYSNILFIFFSFSVYSSEETILSLEEDALLSTRATVYSEQDSFFPLFSPLDQYTDDPFIFFDSTIPLVDTQASFDDALGSSPFVLVISYVIQMGVLRSMVPIYQSLQNSLSSLTIPMYRAYMTSCLTSPPPIGTTAIAPLKAHILPTIKIFVHGKPPTPAMLVKFPHSEFAGPYTLQELQILVAQAYQAFL